MSIRSVHIGVVLDNRDPKKRGGLKVRVDTIAAGVPLGEDFIRPSFPLAGKGSGFFLVPKIGSLVEVEVEAEQDSGIGSLDPSWRCAIYSDVDKVPAEFLTDYPNRGGIKFGDVVLLLDSGQDLLALASSNVRLGEETASHPVMRGDTYNQKLAQFLSDMTTLATTSTAQFNALGTASTTPPGPLAPLAAGFGALAAAWTTFGLAVASFQAASSLWLSTKVKTE